MTASWDDMEFVGPKRLRAEVMFQVLEVDRCPDHYVFTAACNATTRTILNIADTEVGQ